MWSISYPSGTVRKGGVVQTDLAEYVAFLQADGTPTPLQDPPDPLPRIEVTAWQLGQALAADGLLEQVEQLVESSNNALIQFGWRRAPTFYSDQQFTLMIGLQLGKTPADMHALFQRAKAM